MNNRHTELENRLRKMFPIDAYPYVEFQGELASKGIGQAMRFFFNAGSLVIVFEWLLINGKFTEKTRVTFTNPSIIRNEYDVLVLSHNSGKKIAITHLIQYKVSARIQYLEAKRRGRVQ